MKKSRYTVRYLNQAGNPMKAEYMAVSNETARQQFVVEYPFAKILSIKRTSDERRKGEQLL